MKYLLTIIGLAISLAASAQNVDSLLDEILFEDESLIDLLKAESKKKYQFLYFNTGYDGQSTFAGRDLGLDQFSITSQALYFNSSGFNARVYGVWYSQFNPKYNLTGLSLGYSIYPDKKKKWRLRAAYDRYFFADSESSNISNSLSFSSTYKLNKQIRTSVNSSFLIGNEVIPQFSWSTYGSFKLYKKSYLKYISFDPGISVFFSSESLVTQYEQFNRRTRSFTTYEEEEKSFGAMNTRISLPISVNLNNWDFELGYNYMLPSSPLGGTSSESLSNTGFISFSIGYLLDL
ncbi:MAG: hypothetical protein JXQ96_10730 [Cyclobacteriaceae bacterium]